MTTTAPAEVAIREGRRADLLEVARIERESFPKPWPFQAFERFLGEPGFLVAVGDGPDAEPTSETAALLAEDARPVRGFVIADVVADHGRTIGHVKDLAVEPDWRGRGIGSRLLDRALSVLVANGADRAKLEVRVENEAARRLYATFGFSPNHVVPGYYDDGEDALLLVANLADRGV